MKLYIGIDPGANGALAYQTAEGQVCCLKMPEEETEILDFLLTCLDQGDCSAILEKVGGWTGTKYVKDGSEAAAGGAPGSHMFHFGQNYGSLKMALVALDITHKEIIPRTWQKALGISPRKAREGETKSQFKSRLKETALALFPDTVVTLKTCDALLLSEYCKLIHK